MMHTTESDAFADILAAAQDQQTQQRDPALDRRALFVMLRSYQRLERESADSKAWLQTVVDQLNEEQNNRTADMLAMLPEIEQLAAEMRIPGSEHVDVPGVGRVQFTTRKPTLRIADDQAFVDWCEEHERMDLVRVKTTRTPDAALAKAAAVEALAKDGEYLPGFEEVPERTSVTLKWSTK